MYEAHVFERQLSAYSAIQQRRQATDLYPTEAALARGRVLRSQAAVNLFGKFGSWLRGLFTGHGKTAKA